MPHPGPSVVNRNKDVRSEGIIHAGSTLRQWLQLSMAMALVSSSGRALPGVLLLPLDSLDMACFPGF